MDYIKKTSLDTKDTGGNVGQPSYKEGETKLIGKEGFDISGGSNLDTGPQGPNLSAKYKYPRVSQEVSAVQKQYE